jgi:sugar phosphate isomerase/epimerase
VFQAQVLDDQGQVGAPVAEELEVRPLLEDALAELPGADFGAAGVDVLQVRDDEAVLEALEQLARVPHLRREQRPREVVVRVADDLQVARCEPLEQAEQLALRPEHVLHRRLEREDRPRPLGDRDKLLERLVEQAPRLLGIAFHEVWRGWIDQRDPDLAAEIEADYARASDLLSDARDEERELADRIADLEEAIADFARIKREPREHWPEGIEERAEDARRLLARVGHKVMKLERIGFGPDLGHYMRAGIDPIEAVRRSKDRLYGMHLKDHAHIRRGNNPETILGKGALDLPALCNLLREIGFKGPLSLEYEIKTQDPIDDIRKCLANFEEAARKTA